MKKILLSFLLIITILCSTPIYVNANSNTNTELNESMSGMDVFILKGNNFLQAVLETVGVVLNPMKWGEGLLKDRYIDYMCESYLIDNSDTYEGWINSHLKVTERGIEADSEFVNSVYEFVIEIIEEETGYYVHETAESNRVTSYYVNDFATSTQYVALRDYINSNPDKVFIVSSFKGSGVGMYDENGNYTSETVNGIMFRMFDISEFDFVVSKSTYDDYNVFIYDKNWEMSTFPRYVIDLGGTVRFVNFYDRQLSLPLTGVHPYGMDGDYYYVYQYEGYNQSMTINNFPVKVISDSFFITSSGQSLRMYKSLADLKQYSIDQRPYYITDKFQDYDINGDNSCIVTESDLSNGSVYGDVYNYIINNYDNPDSLTEDELRDILNDYLGQGSGTGNGNGNNNGTGNSGSGSGLSGFLSGLGSIGDAILSILGKLLEYVGKAIELLSGTITKVIDLVPSNIVNLFGALFSFVPEEWKTGIELKIAIGVIVGIVCIFKK